MEDINICIEGGVTMLAQRKENYGYYDYEEPLYEEVKEEPKHKIKKAPITVSHTRLDTQLRSRCQTLFILVAVLAMAVTVRSGIIASCGYTLVAVQQQAQQIEQENERLRIEVARLKAPQRIRSIAAQELGMEVPNKMYFAHDR